MAPDPDDDAFAERLFQAARRERPAEGVKQRALSAVAPRRRRASPTRWLLLAAAFGAAFVLLARVRSSDPLSAITAEPIAARPSSAPQSDDRSAASRSLEANAGSKRIEAPAEPALAIPPAVEAAGQPGEGHAAAAGASANAASHALHGAQPKATPVTLEQELALLDDARRSLLDGETAAALARLSHYDKVATSRRLGAEATLLRIQILAAAGRSLEASELASGFVAKNPNSPLVDRAKSFIQKPVSEEENRGNTP